MSNQLKIGFITILVIVSLCLTYANYSKSDCEERINYDNIHVNDGINLDSLFAPADSLELAEIWKNWEEFDAKSESYQILQEIPMTDNRKFLIIEHIAEGRKHFGAILTPSDYDETKKYPAIVWLAGLDQRNPSLNFRHSPFQLFPKNYFGILPSYRGQALLVDGEHHCSDGFFGDAFDGATDDAIRLLELAKNNFKGIDKERIAVAGGSRGGTVALLMAARDTTINACVSMAGPVDFHNRDPFNRYGSQFRYQFLNEVKPMHELRKKMLKSSPINFINRYSNALFVIHGKNDSVVPVLNAKRVIKIFEGRDNFDFSLLDAGHQTGAMDTTAGWVTEWNQ